MWGAHDAMGWWMLFGGALWLIFIVSLVYLFARALGDGSRATGGPEEPPLEIAKRRLAVGEISHEEFDLIRQKLG